MQWKAAVVFEKAVGKPILHTQTHDLSLGGTAIHSHYDDLTGSLVTLLLAHPPRNAGETPRMLKVRARIVSTVNTPPEAGFRHGLSFVRSPEDGLEILAEFLGLAQDSGPGAEAAAPPVPAQAAAPPVPAQAASPAPAPAATSRLEQLRQLAAAKQAEPTKVDPQEEIDARVGASLSRAFEYFKELTEQLNVVKPPNPSKGYAIFGVPDFAGLAWEKGRADCRLKEVSASEKRFEQASLHFTLSGNKQVRVERENPAHEKLKRLLEDYKIEFKVQEKKSERGSLERVTFSFPCEVACTLHLYGKFETGKVLLSMRNVERFGTMERLIAPEAITHESLEELTGFILGETSHLGPLLLQGA